RRIPSERRRGALPGRAHGRGRPLPSAAHDDADDAARRGAHALLRDGRLLRVRDAGRRTAERAHLHDAGPPRHARRIATRRRAPRPRAMNGPLLIVGGGPAGLSAALAAAEPGVRSTVVAEGLDLGGPLSPPAPRLPPARA